MRICKLQNIGNVIPKRHFLHFGSDKQLNVLMQSVDECGYFDQQQENEEEEEEEEEQVMEYLL